MSTVEKTDAIVLRSAPIRETSLIITFLSRDFGKIKTISKGVRKGRSPLLSHFEPFTYQEIVFYHHPQREINLITDSTVKESFSFIRNDFVKICVASYMVDLVDEVTQAHQQQKELFNLLLYVLCELKCTHPLKLLRLFEVNVLKYSGLFPNLEKCSVCGRAQLPSRLFFSFHHGGIICSQAACRQKAREHIDISSGCIAAMKFLKEHTFTDLNAFQVSNTIEGEMMRLMQSFIYKQLHN
ncbi:MAG: DNA repair protein RecO [Candidatus Omnitrophota bacterium]